MTLHPGQVMEDAVENWDLIVAGASFSGIAAARCAAMRGLSTLILEKKSDPGQSPHTTGLLVKEAADEWDVPRALTRKIHGVRLYAPSLHWVDLDSPGYSFLATDMPELMRWWAGEASASGVSMRWATPYPWGSHLRDDGIALGSYGLQTRFLIGADGPRSRVAQDRRLGTNRQFLIGVEAEYTGVSEVHQDRLHVFLDSQLAPGYIAWVVPGVNGITQIGLACRAPGKPQLGPFTEKISGLFNFEKAQLVGHRGGAIPCGGPVSKIGDAHTLLVGDAAGLVSPLTAGGIHTALASGRVAGIAVSDYLEDGGHSPATVLRHQMPRFFWKRIMRQAFDLYPPNEVYNRALSNRFASKMAKLIFFHHRGLYSCEAWRSIAHEEKAALAPPSQ